MPDVRGGSHFVLASDYSGQHAGATHKTYSFLLASVDQSQSWEVARARFRERLGDQRRISYKDLRDQRKWRALPEFLAAADQIVGVLATFIVDRRFDTLLPPTINDQIGSLLPQTLPVPSSAILEDMVRTAHFIVLLIAGLLRDDQGVQWITDEDAIVQNEIRQTQMRSVLSTVSKAHHKEVPYLKFFNMGLTSSPDPSRIIEDFASIPDLAAGAVASYFEERPELLSQAERGRLDPPPKNMQAKTYQILDWIGSKNVPLKRWTFLLTPTSPPAHSVWALLLRVVGPGHTPRGLPVTFARTRRSS